MFRIGKSLHYALVAMFHLDRVAGPGVRLTAHDLSRRYDMPEPHLGKVLHRLVKAGLLRSVQGVQGGYELHRELKEVQLGDVIRAVGGKSAPMPRDSHTILTIFPTCYVQGLAHEVEQNVMKQIHAMKLTEVLSQLDLPEPQTLEATG